jgi:hypothetical protein
MSRIGSLLAVAFLATISCLSPGVAISPATPEQMLCGATYIFVGRAIEAAPVRARPNMSSDNKNGVNLTVAVRRVIGVKAATSQYRSNPVLGPGDTIRATTHARTDPFSSAGRFGHQGGLVFTGPYDSVVPDDLLTAAYKDEDFIYSAHLGVDRPGERALVSVWPLEKEEWVRKTMAMYAKMGLPCSAPN